MSTRAARRTTLAASALALAMVVTALVGSAAAGLTWRQVLDDYELTNSAIGASFVACGSVIVWWARRNPVGWLFVGAGLAHLTTASLWAVAYLLVAADTHPVLGAWIATFAGQVWGFGVTGLFLVALLLFPDGRLVSRAWWAVIVLVGMTDLGQLVTGVLAPGPVLPGQTAQSPLALADPTDPRLTGALNLAGVVTFLAVLVSLVLRYVRGDERVRRQLFWLVLAVVAILALNAQRVVTGTGPIPLLLTFVLVPVAIAIAILRYGLLDIRLVVSRTLTYGVLIALVTALFAGIVAGLDLVLPTDGVRGAPIVAAIVVAVAFAPLRTLLVRTVGRALYGRRADPSTIAGRLGDELAAATDSLDGALALLRAELRLPYLALGNGPVLAESGSPPDGTVTLPLPGLEEADLVVGLRRGERTLHDADRRALELLSVPLVVARRALTLGAAVAEARTEVVTERERERQRLQRELHDGLGPRLTGIAFRLDAAANVLDRDPARAARFLADSRTDLRAALGTVRDVVHDLRPIELDDGGLVPALRARLAEIAETAPLGVELVADDLPRLSAAVEVATFRVALEAVTNAVRHSDGTRCRVALTADGEAVLLRVDDDGQAARAWHPGVGLASMRHRAGEVGGTLEAGPTPEGWSVCARLPALPPETAAQPADQPDAADLGVRGVSSTAPA